MRKRDADAVRRTGVLRPEDNSPSLGHVTHSILLCLDICFVASIIRPILTDASPISDFRQNTRDFCVAKPGAMRYNKTSKTRRGTGAIECTKEAPR